MSVPIKSNHIFSLVINGINLVLILVAAVCVIFNRSLERTLKSVLLSFNVANIVGACLLAYTPLNIVLCNGNGDKLNDIGDKSSDVFDVNRFDFVILITNVLSISHVLMLILHYYIKLTSSRKHRKLVTDYTGLVVISWVVSATLGSMNLILQSKLAQVLIIVVFTSIVAYAFKKFNDVYKIHKTKTKINGTRRQNIQVDIFSLRELENYWCIKHVAIIFFSYVLCALPWMINEVREAFTGIVSPTFHDITLNVFAFSYVIPSYICIQMKLKDWIVQNVLKKRRIDVERENVEKERLEFQDLCLNEDLDQSLVEDEEGS